MRSSGTTSLFGQSTDRGQRPTSFVVSLLVHGIVISIVWFAVAYRPPFTRVVTDRYSVRKLDLHMPDMQKLNPNPLIPYPSDHSSAHASRSASSASSAPAPAAMARTAQTKTGPQTLIQPDVPKPIQLSQEIPLPQVMIWAPNKVQVKTITPPQPQKPASSEAKPSVESPNQEIKLADVNVASSFHPSPKNIVQPSATSPVTAHAQLQTQSPPVTTSQSALQATPVQILSLSDLRAKDATVNLPPVSETKASNSQGTLGPGQAQKSPSQSSANAKAEGSGNGQNPAAKPNGAGSGAGPNANAPAGSVAGSGPPGHTGNTSGPGSDQGAMAGATLITTPKDGRFSSVIVGDSLQDQYPEIGEIWNGRLTYTAYLRVGLTKSWILQYSLPRTGEAASAGTVQHLDAPWPFSIVRPNLEPGTVDADALMVHGFVNQSGRFETLTILFPEDFPRAQFVLAALKQWQFRPAAQDGQPAKVEVLLIIPEEYE
jgi:hypothetical protein